ncbi:MAG: hypothetical protein Q9187_004286 [Circinaria calcarea]
MELLGLISLSIEITKLVLAIKDNLQAEKTYTRTFRDAAENLDRKLREIKQLGLAPEEDRFLDQWRLNCHEILVELHAYTRSGSELHSSRYQTLMTAVPRRLCFDPKEAERLTNRFSAHVSQLGEKYAYLNLQRR